MSWRRMVGATLLTLCALACAANPRVAEPAAPLPEGAPAAEAASPVEGQQAPSGAVRIESVTAQGGEVGTLVTIRGDRPLSYTSYDPDSATLVLELPDSDATSVAPVIEVGTPQLARIHVSTTQSRSGSTHARIELQGRASAETRIDPQGSSLIVFLEGTSDTAAATSAPASTDASETPDSGSEPAAGQADQAAAEALIQSSGSVSPATELTQVSVSGTPEQPVVTLEGNGALEFKSFELEGPSRLVVDLIGVDNAVKRRKIAIDGEGVQRVRLSQFSEEPDKVTRVVFDLNRNEDYRIDSSGSSLAVNFLGLRSEGASAQAAEASADEPAAETAQAGAFRAGDNVEAAPKPAPDAAPAADTPAAQQPESNVRPASSKLEPIGKDVVLFDRADARMASAQGTSMTTLPQSMFESKTIAGGQKTYRGEKISVAFRDADLREVMFFFADVMKMNVVLDPDVAGKVDIRLNQVPWDQAFQVILKNQGLDAIEENNVVRIARTSKLRQEAADLRALKTAQEQAVDPVTFTRTLSYAKVQDAMQVLQQVKTERGKIVADIRTNTLVIQDIPDRKIAYEGLLDALDTQTPQVVIEARIVEAIRSFERDLGINWAFATTRSGATGNPYPYRFPNRVEFTADVNTAPLGFPSAGGIGLALGNIMDTITLDVTLEAFEADGKVRILSSPKIATQNNQPATIEQGVQIPVVTTTATEVDVQYVPASLRLIVTPQITAEDTVIMKLKVENNQPSSTVSVADVPGIVTESVDTQILVRTGTTAVIGGVYKLQEAENETGIPGLRRIPFFGWLFKNRTNRKDSSELLVFITPKIVKNI